MTSRRRRKGGNSNRVWNVHRKSIIIFFSSGLEMVTQDSFSPSEKETKKGAWILQINKKKPSRIIVDLREGPVSSLVHHYETSGPAAVLSHHLLSLNQHHQTTLQTFWRDLHFFFLLFVSYFQTRQVVLSPFLYLFSFILLLLLFTSYIYKTTQTAILKRDARPYSRPTV